jgi:hypothetical protein
MKYSPQGIPIQSLEEKINSLKYCMERNLDEDSVGHLFDLLYHICPNWKFLRFNTLQEIADYYAEHPTPIE